MEFVNNNNIYILNEYIFNYGKGVKSADLLKDFLEVRHHNGIMDRSTLSPLVKAFLKAYMSSQLDNHFLDNGKVIHYETILQKDLYFNQQIINTEAEFDKIYDELSVEKNILFRGLPEAKYALYSRLQREWIEEQLHKKHTSYADFLKTMINAARSENNKILPRYFQNTGFNEQNDLTVLSFLQHHGCPTPILDWTGNFNVALYFGTDFKKIDTPQKYIDKYFSVYLIEQKYFNDISINSDLYKALKANNEMLKQQVLQELERNNLAFVNGEITDDMIQKVALSSIIPGVIYEMSKIDHLMDLPTSYLSEINEMYPLPNYLLNNFNIISQEGSFTWNNDPIMPFEFVVKRDNSVSEDHKDNYIANCININKGLKNYIVKKLAKNGIKRSTIFPDSNKFAKAIYKKCKHP